MSEISFYHLEVSSLEVALPKLMEKVYSSGFKSVIRFGNPELIESLNKALWKYDPASFLPHGTKKSGHESEQPIYLTCENDNPNESSLLLMVNDADFDGFEDFERVLLMFDGHSEPMILKAREAWKKYKDEGHKLVYFQQNENGGWQKKMETG